MLPAQLHGDSSVEEILRFAADTLDAGLPAAVSPSAVFDCDGTLWSGDIGLSAFRSQAEAGLWSSSLLDEPLCAWGRSVGLDLADASRSTHQDLVNLIDSGEYTTRATQAGLSHNVAQAELYAMHAWSYAGATIGDVEAHGNARWVAEVRDQTFPFTRPLIDGLFALGIRTFAVSASPEFILRAALVDLGIPPGRVFGMLPRTDEQGVVVAEAKRKVYGPGKVDVLDEELSHAPFRPLLAFGDSVVGGDAELLARAHQAVAVAPLGRHLGAARAQACCVIGAARS